MARFSQRGDVFPYTPGSDVAAGTIIVVGSVVGLAERPIAANDTGDIRIAGVLADVPKASAASYASGEATNWDAAADSGNGQAVKTGGVAMGAAYGAFGAGTTTMKVLLRQH